MYILHIYYIDIGKSWGSQKKKKKKKKRIRVNCADCILDCTVLYCIFIGSFIYNIIDNIF